MVSNRQRLAIMWGVTLIGSAVYIALQLDEYGLEGHSPLKLFLAYAFIPIFIASLTLGITVAYAISRKRSPSGDIDVRSIWVGEGACTSVALVFAPMIVALLALALLFAFYGGSGDGYVYSALFALAAVVFVAMLARWRKAIGKNEA
ncbi:MAG: hypothetical protein LBG62_05640 [Candidatus Methanoplasma sp.]|nr:hypothetical protein [Candidatus Methanoplasma sp.]